MDGTLTTDKGEGPDLGEKEPPAKRMRPQEEGMEEVGVVPATNVPIVAAVPEAVGENAHDGATAPAPHPWFINEDEYFFQSLYVADFASCQGQQLPNNFLKMAKWLGHSKAASICTH